jgi:septal ring factor EnvC (AmiA/AmiB activator)
MYRAFTEPSTEPSAITRCAPPLPAAVHLTQQHALAAYRQAQAALQEAQARYAALEDQRATLQQELVQLWADQEAARLALRRSFGTLAGTAASLENARESLTGC